MYIVIYTCARKSRCDEVASRRGGTVHYHNGNWEVRIYHDPDESGGE